MDKMIPLDVYSDIPNNTVNIENKQDDDDPDKYYEVNINFKGCGNCMHKDVCKYKDQMQNLSFQIPYIPVLKLYSSCILLSEKEPVL